MYSPRPRILHSNGGLDSVGSGALRYSVSAPVLRCNRSTKRTVHSIVYAHALFHHAIHVVLESLLAHIFRSSATYAASSRVVGLEVLKAGSSGA